MGELAGARAAITRGLHDPRSSDIVWLERDNDGALALHVAQSHLGSVIRRTIVDTHRAVVFTSATLAVAGSFDFALDRFGIADVADTLAVGSPFDYPLSSRFDENDAIFVFDNAFIPWEDVLLHRDLEKAKVFFAKSGFLAGYQFQGCTRLAVKLDFMVGVIVKALRAAGRDWRPVCEVSSMEPLLASIEADLASTEGMPDEAEPAPIKAAA